MNSNFFKKYYHILFIIILIFITAPFFILFNYNFPVNDDYCISIQFRQFGFVNAISDYYFHWGSRIIAFAHHFFLDSMIKNIIWFRIIGFSFLLIHFYSVFYFLKTVFNRNELKLTFTFFVFFIIIELLYLPSIHQGIFWYSGVASYLLPFSYFLFSISFFLKHKESKQIKYFFLTVFFIILSAGSNELIASFLFSLLLLYKIFNFSQSNYTLKINKFEIAIFLILSLIIILMILSPGNHSRNLTIENQYSFLNSISESFKIVSLQSIKWLQNGVIICISILFINSIYVKNYFISNLKVSSFIIVLFGFFCIIFISIFPPLYFGGELPDRALNITFLLFIFFYFFSIWMLASLLNERIKIVELSILYKLLVMSFIVFQLKDGNIRIAYLDILTGDAKQYSKEWDDRILKSKQNKGKDLYFKSISICPQSICGDDLKSERDNWKNACYSSYYEIKTVEIKNN
jgi:hypothetical protein